jgi:membrane protein YdbS with pleckstrin-like domain
VKAVHALDCAVTVIGYRIIIIIAAAAAVVVVVVVVVVVIQKKIKHKQHTETR